jgi:hypothetical protein
MKRETILKKLESYYDRIEDQLENISTLLEIDCEDDELAEMSVQFREQVEQALTDNTECSYSTIVDYIKENL